MDAYIIYRPSRVSPAYADLQVQETRMALFLVRPMLLHNGPQLRLDMARTAELEVVDRMLLLVAWVFSECRHHMEEQFGFPRLGQSHIIVRSHIPTTRLHSHPVR